MLSAIGFCGGSPGEGHTARSRLGNGLRKLGFARILLNVAPGSASAARRHINLELEARARRGVTQTVS